MAYFVEHPRPAAPFACGFADCRESQNLFELQTPEHRRYHLCGVHLAKVRRKDDVVRVLYDGPDDPGGT